MGRVQFPCHWYFRFGGLDFATRLFIWFTFAAGTLPRVVRNGTISCTQTNRFYGWRLPRCWRYFGRRLVTRFRDEPRCKGRMQVLSYLGGLGLRQDIVELGAEIFRALLK